jgi:hypothetical protein
MFVYQGLAFHSMSPQSTRGRERFFGPLRSACHIIESSDKQWEATCPFSQHRLVVATNSPLNAAQLLWQVGVDVPVVRVHGAYTSTSYAPREERGVLIFRFPLWDRPVGTSFRGLLRHFCEAAASPLSFVFLEAGEFMSHKELGQHQAVFLFPWDSELVVFQELYAAGVPLLLPDLEWLVKWQSFIPWGSTDLGEVSGVRNDWSLSGGLRPLAWPCAPWLNNQGTLTGSWTQLDGGLLAGDCARFWVGETSFLRFAGVLHVASIAELAVADQLFDFAKASGAMLSSAQKALHKDIEFYRWTIASLLLS